MQQLAFRFDPTPALSVTTEPTWFRVDLDKKGHSYAEIGITANGDGTWRVSSRDNFQGFCGHGSPSWGAYPTFSEALASRINQMISGYQLMADGNAGSCCSSKHEAMARLGLKWLAGIADEYNIQLRKPS